MHAQLITLKENRTRVNLAFYYYYYFKYLDISGKLHSTIPVLIPYYYSNLSNCDRKEYLLPPNYT